MKNSSICTEDQPGNCDFFDDQTKASWVKVEVIGIGAKANTLPSHVKLTAFILAAHTDNIHDLADRLESIEIDLLLPQIRDLSITRPEQADSLFQKYLRVRLTILTGLSKDHSS